LQVAFAEFVQRDPLCAGLSTFYQRKRDLFRELIAGSRFRPLPCEGTFFQLADYSAIGDERDSDFAIRLTREHGVAAIPITPFLHGEDPGRVVRFCFAKRDETLAQAAARLRTV
jgi:methionine aminotransferase